MAGGPMKENYIGAVAFTGGENPIGKENVLNDETGLMMAKSVGRRVAERNSRRNILKKWN